MELASQLGKNATSATPAEWQPQLFDPKRGEHRHQINGLLTKGSWVQVHDTIEEQTHEVIKARRPSRTFTKQELDQEATNIWLVGLFPVVALSGTHLTGVRVSLSALESKLLQDYAGRTEPIAFVYHRYRWPISG